MNRSSIPSTNQLILNDQRLFFYASLIIVFLLLMLIALTAYFHNVVINKKPNAWVVISVIISIFMVLLIPLSRALHLRLKWLKHLFVHTPLLSGEIIRIERVLNPKGVPLIMIQLAIILENQLIHPVITLTPLKSIRLPLEDLDKGNIVEVLVDPRFPPRNVSTQAPLEYTPGQFNAIFSVRGGVILPRLYFNSI